MPDTENDQVDRLQRVRRDIRQAPAQIRRLVATDPQLVAVAAAGLIVSAACSVVIAKLLDSVMGGGDDTELDAHILDWVVQHRTARLTGMAQAITHLADPLVVIVITAVVAGVLVRVRRPRLALLLVVCTLGTAALTTATKCAVDRARPPQQLWLSTAAGPAFPSGHSAQAVACYGSLAVIGCAFLKRPAPRAGMIASAMVIGVLIGVSRVYLAVHWPSDVIAGWSVASLWLCVLLLTAWVTPRLRSAHRIPSATI